MLMNSPLSPRMQVKDKRFVFTGDLSKEREYYMAKIISLGGKVTMQISNKTDYLVVGKNGGPVKIRTANEKGCKIVDEHAVNMMIEHDEEYNGKSNNVNDNMKNGKSNGDIKNNKHNSNGSIKNDKYNVEDNNDNIKNDNNGNIRNDNVRNTVSGSTSMATMSRVDIFNSLWTNKYEPKRLEDVLGNKTAKDHLVNYLKNYKKGRGLLISGPPGTGKSLSVKLACQQLDMQRIEFNASDVRNKSSLSEYVGQFVNCACISQKKRVLVMDECDGMTSDRGGLAELAQIIRMTHLPVVCICNDKQAVRSLLTVCDEVVFRKLETRQILGCIRNIVKKEGRSIQDADIVKTCMSANNDMRYILNNLQGCVSSGTGAPFRKIVAKNIFDNLFEIFSNSRVADKMDVFFREYDMMPLMLFENYLRSDVCDVIRAGRAPVADRLDVFGLCSTLSTNMSVYARSSDSISLADTFLKKMGGSDWSLLSVYGLLSTVVPSKNLKISQRAEFPKLLGHTSKHNKHMDVFRTFHFHFNARSDITEFIFYDLPLLLGTYVDNLSRNMIDENVRFLVSTNLLKSDCDDALDVLGMGKGVDGKSKAAMTRAYKKIERKLPY